MKKVNEKWAASGYALTMEVEIIAIRDEIKMNKPHKKDKRTLTVAAYNEIRKHMGKSAVKMNCGNCGDKTNRLLRIWLEKYDKRTKAQEKLAKDWIKKMGGNILPSEAVASADTSGELIPKDERRDVLDGMNYWDLVKEFDKLPKESQDAALSKMGGKRLKKVEIIDALILG